MADRFSDPEELERYIERTRKDLARNVDEIADRVNPKNVANRGVERLKEEAGQVAKAFGALVRPSDEDEDGQGGGIDKRVVLAGVGAAVTVTALVLWRRKRRRR
ncbi:DUF3618 domain-containing protein [Actinomadura sp. BRA 177]|uniref:DUF3618 domain-containing protein n=1 Tax=Actinomadura sp. BRA 177 TaxID=2745202 RepID=UPI001596215F|nr:DUF3618 domain-containing protein [Actinomadura sp. BRA 177]NVI91927.1 DUF3618 domain-containing protein [Actinomadura sp. BRA 177]